MCAILCCPHSDAYDDDNILTLCTKKKKIVFNQMKSYFIIQPIIVEIELNRQLCIEHTHTYILFSQWSCVFFFCATRRIHTWSSQLTRIQAGKKKQKEIYIWIETDGKKKSI